MLFITKIAELIGKDQALYIWSLFNLYQGIRGMIISFQSSDILFWEHIPLLYSTEGRGVKQVFVHCLS